MKQLRTEPAQFLLDPLQASSAFLAKSPAEGGAMKN